MTVPSILLGILFSTLYGAFFHLFRGGSLGRLILYIIISWAGFWAGQFLSDYAGWNFGTLGTLHLVIASLGSFLFLGVGYWLSLVQVADESVK